MYDQKKSTGWNFDNDFDYIKTKSFISNSCWQEKAARLIRIGMENLHSKYKNPLA